VSPRAGLNDVGKRKFLTLPGLVLRPLGRPARGESLHQLSYPGSHLIHIYTFLLFLCLLWFHTTPVVEIPYPVEFLNQVRQ
jgi:hypothetical protein